MKFNKVIVPILLIFIILISLSAVYADEISDDEYLDIQNDDVSIESDSNIGFSENDLKESNPTEVDTENALKNVSSENILKSDDEDVLEIDYPQTHDESYNIVVDAKPSGNKGKVGDEIRYAITVTNNNPFAVHNLEVFSPDDPDHFWLHKESTSKSNVHVGFLDETAWIIDKLGPGETIIIYATIKIDAIGKSELSISLSHNHPPYEYISYDEDDEKSNMPKSSMNNFKKSKEKSILKKSIDLSSEKTANPIALLILSICSLFLLNTKNRKSNEKNRK